MSRVVKVLFPTVEVDGHLEFRCRECKRQTAEVPRPGRPADVPHAPGCAVGEYYSRETADTRREAH